MLREGGSYIVEKPGAEPKLLHRTKDHPQGNRPRNAKGAALDLPKEKPKAADSTKGNAKKQPASSGNKSNVKE